MTTIALDIEVAGFPWEEVDEITRGYLLRRAKDEGERDAVPERLALYPGLGKVIAIGLWMVDEQRGLCLLEGRDAPARDWERVPGSKVFRGDERALLAEFWRIAGHKGVRLVSFNGRQYDGPVLMIRSAQHGLAPSLNLVGNRYSLAPHCDLVDVFGFFGAWRERYNLDYWCRRFDVESPKGSIDGSQVGRAYREGRIEEIGEYCLRDVRATAELFARVRDTLLPLLPGGR